MKIKFHRKKTHGGWNYIKKQSAIKKYGSDLKDKKNKIGWNWKINCNFMMQAYF
jgi:hypothetical protein